MLSFILPISAARIIWYSRPKGVTSKIGQIKEWGRDSGLIGKVWQAGLPTICGDYSEISDFATEPFLISAQALIAIPLKSNQQVFGVAGLWHEKSG